MDSTTLENWLWDAACAIRGPLDAPKFKDYSLPLLFFKRLSDVYQDELKRLGQEYGDEAFARDLVQADPNLVRFVIPEGYTWDDVRKQPNLDPAEDKPVTFGVRLTNAVRAIARKNEELQGVIDRRDFNATESGQRVLDDGMLSRLVELLNRQRLGLHDVSADILGEAYQYLLRKFAEGGGQSAGEFFTPLPVALLMAYILDPEQGESFYDPNDYNLSPSRYVSQSDGEPPLPLEEALVLLAEAEEERVEVDTELDKVLVALGFSNWRGN